MTDAELIVWVSESRAAQGLPPAVLDPVLIARAAAILADVERDAKAAA
jgi:hypothetical protein